MNRETRGDRRRRRSGESVFDGVRRISPNPSLSGSPVATDALAPAPLPQCAPEEIAGCPPPSVPPNPPAESGGPCPEAPPPGTRWKLRSTQHFVPPLPQPAKIESRDRATTMICWNIREISDGSSSHFHQISNGLQNQYRHLGGGTHAPVGVSILQVSRHHLGIVREGDLWILEIRMPHFFPLVRVVPLVADVDERLDLLL